MKIGTKLMVIITAVNLAGIGGLTISSVMFSSEQIVSISDEYVNTVAVNAGSQIRAYLEVPLDEIRAVAQISDHIDEYPLAERRQELDFMLRALCESNPDFVGVWAAFEANALDGRDALYVNTDETDETGRFQSYYQNDHGRVTVKPMGNFSVEDYYRTSFFSGKEGLIEPYYEDVGGEQVLITSLTVPITRNGRVIGVAGIDLELTDIQDMVSKIKPYGTGIAGAFSHTGIIVAHPDPSRAGRQMQETEHDTGGNIWILLLTR